VDSPRSDTAPAPAPDLAAWFAAEVQPHEPHLRAYLRRSFPGVRDVDDVVQESYLRLWRKRTARPLVSARAFLFRIARNFAVDLLREPRGAQPLDALPEIADEAPGARDAAGRREFEALLTAALDALPARQREVIVLCKLRLLAPREAAAQLGLAEKTINEHLYRGLRRLGAELKRRDLDSASASP
jgi:RNA polymerase sigma-70 factor (ECF subfamily)